MQSFNSVGADYSIGGDITNYIMYTIDRENIKPEKARTDLVTKCKNEASLYILRSIGHTGQSLMSDRIKDIIKDIVADYKRH